MATAGLGMNLQMASVSPKFISMFDPVVKAKKQKRERDGDDLVVTTLTALPSAEESAQLRVQVCSKQALYTTMNISIFSGVCLAESTLNVHKLWGSMAPDGNA